MEGLHPASLVRIIPMQKRNRCLRSHAFIGSVFLPSAPAAMDPCCKQAKIAIVACCSMSSMKCPVLEPLPASRFLERGTVIFETWNDSCGFACVRWPRSQLVLLTVFLMSSFLACCGVPAASQSSSGDRGGGQETPEQIEKAVAAYEKLLDDPPPGTTQSVLVGARMRLGTAYFLLHRYPESLKTLAPLLDTDRESPSPKVSQPKNGSDSALTHRLMLAQAWLISGLDHLELDQVQEAIVPLRRTLVLDPKNANARMALGDAFARSHRTEDAEKQYEAQLEQTPALPDAWYKLGMAHAQLSADLSQGLAHGSNDSILAQQLTSEYMLLGERNWDAARILLQIAKTAPGQPGIHADLGRALFALGYTKSAANEFRKELALDPEAPGAMLGLAESAILQGAWAEANSELKELALSHPKQFTELLESAPAGPLREAWTEGKVKIPDNIAESAEGIVWRAWLSASVITSEMVLSAAGNRAATCTSLPSAAATIPGLWLSEDCYRDLRGRLEKEQHLSLDKRIKLAEATFRLGYYQQTRQQAQSILQLYPNSDWGRYWLSKAHSELAGDCFVKVGVLNPSSERVHQMLGDRYAGYGQLSEALAEYSTAIRLAPNLPDLHLGLGNTYARMRSWPDAVTEFKKAIELAPGSPTLQAKLGHAYVELGEWELAIAALRQISGDPSMATDVRLDLSNAEDHTGHTQQAIADLLPIAAQDKDGEIHFRMAAFYRKLGDAEHAKEAIEAFRQLRAADLAVSHGQIQSLEDDKQGNVPGSKQESP